ncbi:MAG: deoxyribodipyrimidine photo-lyase, partial [Elainellaceae cyanobacterium]
MTDLILFWHRRDLRLCDNVGLAAARQQSPKVIGVFCLDPALLERDDIAPARMKYMMESLAELQDSYAQAGSHLLILQDDPVKAIPALARALSATAAFWNWDVEPYAQERDRQVRDALKELGINVHTTWDQLLHGPGEVRTKTGKPYTVYTPFWKNWKTHPKAAPEPRFSDAERLSSEEKQAADDAGAIALPTAKELGFEWDAPLLLEPGEAAAQTRLEDFCDGDRTIAEYDDQRNFPAVPGTSHLSAALKFGTLGIRTAWAMADDALSRSRSDDTHRNIETWEQELAWREFYQHAMYFFPELA